MSLAVSLLLVHPTIAPARWAEFRVRYLEELKGNKEQISILRQKAAKGTVTLVCAAKDQEHNEAVILQSLLTAK